MVLNVYMFMVGSKMRALKRRDQNMVPNVCTLRVCQARLSDMLEWRVVSKPGCSWLFLETADE